MVTKMNYKVKVKIGTYDNKKLKKEQIKLLKEMIEESISDYLGFCFVENIKITEK